MVHVQTMVDDAFGTIAAGAWVELENIWMEMSADRCTQRTPAPALLVQLHVETARETWCV